MLRALRAMLGIFAVAVAISTCLAQPEGAETRSRPVRSQEQAFLAHDPQVGAMAPDFTLRTPDGDSIRLSDLYATKPVVLEFGCITCPVYRGLIGEMNRLRERFGDAVHWLVIYTVEAHPFDSPDPYSGRIWPHRRNEQAGVLLPQPETYEDRVALANRVADELASRCRSSWTGWTTRSGRRGAGARTRHS